MEFLGRIVGCGWGVLHISDGCSTACLFLHSIRVMKGPQEAQDEHGITPFQAFVTGLASRVGVGNVAGVAIAIAIGGPGAVFWMWVTVFLGMSSAFVESLAQVLK